MPTSAWTRHPKARQSGIYWRQRSKRLEYGFLRPGGNVEYAGTELQDAIDARSQAVLDRSQGKKQPNRTLTIRDLAEAVRETKQARLRPSSLRVFDFALETYILPELGHLKPRQLDADRIERFERDLMRKHNLSAATVRRYVSPLGPILKLAVRRGCIETTPMMVVDHQPIERPEHYEWTTDDVRSLLEAAKALSEEEGRSKTYYPLIALLAYTGMRVGEALALRWSSVSLPSRKLTVSHSWDKTSNTLSQPKTSAGRRVVALPEPLVEILKAYKPKQLGDDWVFPSPWNDKPISYTAFRARGFEPALKKAGLNDRGITVHSLRHCAASLLIASGVSDVDVAAHLGHANPNVTRAIYAHVFDRSGAQEQIRQALGQV